MRAGGPAGHFVPMQVSSAFCPTFPLPKTRIFSFRELLFSNDPGILEFIERANAIRGSLVSALNVGDSERSIAVIKEYLPMLIEIKNLLVQDDGKLQSRGVMAFTWTSGCDKKQGKKEYTLHGLQFETAMIVAALAYAHSNKATTLFGTISTDEDFEPIAKKVAALYRSAAGLSDYVADAALPLSTLPYSRPPEVLPDLHRALSCIFRCCAQQVYEFEIHLRAHNHASSSPLMAGMCTPGSETLSFPAAYWEAVYRGKHATVRGRTEAFGSGE